MLSQAFCRETKEAADVPWKMNIFLPLSWASMICGAAAASVFAL